MSSNWSYEDAVRKLLSLQSVMSDREQMRKDQIAGKKNTTLEEMEKLLQRIGIPLSRLDELSVIHVAGSKGKGSTCSMCESILRRHGFRTGFVSGPHLLEHRERIRLDGRPLAPDQFAAHVQRLYGLLLDTQEIGSAMPSFLPFMTALAFHVFLEEEVDVAVVETGFGGSFDASNVLRKVPVVGITSLGLDHTDVLGETLAEIAAAKAGIMKRGCQVYSAPQPGEAMDVLIARANYLNCSLTVVPQLSDYMFTAGEGPRLPVDVPTYRTNASLAVQLAHAWLRIASGDTAPRLEREVPRETAVGLTQFRWPGRYHVLDERYAKFYLDGAYTKESMEVCVQWFTDTIDSTTNKILIFSCSANRDVETLFQYLRSISFKEVYFVREFEQMNEKCMRLWENHSGANVMGFECVHDALNTMTKEHKKPSVLITGSLRLISDALSILDPRCTC